MLYSTEEERLKDVRKDFNELHKIINLLYESYQIMPNNFKNRIYIEDIATIANTIDVELNNIKLIK